MKIIGTYEEICAMHSFLLDTARHCTYQQPYRDLNDDPYAGKWKGFDVYFEIIKKPMVIGMIMPQVNFLTNLVCIADQHGGLSFAKGGTPRPLNERKCENGTTICVYNSFSHLRGYKLDELWTESLPSDWNNFDLCMSSVGGDRNKIHFYKELEKEKEAK